MGRKKKTETETPVIETVAHTEQELAIIAKYPGLSMKSGSWRASGGRAETHGHKVTVITICPCGVETVRATSDIWQCGSLCPACRKAAKKGKATKRKEAK